RLLGSCREAAEKAGQPEAHAAFIGYRACRHRDRSNENKRPREGTHACAPLDRQLFHVRPRGSMPVSCCRDCRLAFVARCGGAAVSARAELHDSAASAPRTRHRASGKTLKLSLSTRTKRVFWLAVADPQQSDAPRRSDDPCLPVRLIPSATAWR